MTAYSAADQPSSPQVLLLIQDTVYDLDLTRQKVQPLPLAQPCWLFLSTTADGKWAACQADAGIAVFSLPPAPVHEYLVGPNSRQGGPRSPSWAPDGTHIAVADWVNGCPIAIDSVAPSHQTVRVAICLTIVGLYIDEVSWSDDGAWLVVLGGTGAHDLAFYAVHVGPLVARVAQQRGQPVDVVLPATSLVPLHPGPQTMPVWSLVPNVVTVAEGHPTAIVQRNLLTGEQSVDLQPLPRRVCAMSWTREQPHPRLIFVLCNRGDAEYSGAADQLYGYKPV
jgi:hypothetical protein